MNAGEDDGRAPTVRPAAGEPSSFDVVAFRTALTSQRYGHSLEAVAETGSTNDDARARAEAGAPDGHVVVADAQRRGRGTHGRTWSSDAPAVDLTFSLVVRRGCAPPALSLLALATGLAVGDALGSMVDAPYAIKWPNDVLFGGRKVAGVLVEAATRGARMEHAVVGVGVNVNRRAFAGVLAASATSLLLTSGREWSRADVLARVLEHMERQHDALSSETGREAVVAALSARLAWRDARVKIDGVQGVAVGVAPSGALLFQADGANAPAAVVAGHLEPCEPASRA